MEPKCYSQTCKSVNNPKLDIISSGWVLKVVTTDCNDKHGTSMTLDQHVQSWISPCYVWRGRKMFGANKHSTAEYAESF